MKHTVLALALMLASCNVSNEAADNGVTIDSGLDGSTLDGGDQDGAATRWEASSTDVCHKRSAICGWHNTGMCQIIYGDAVGGGIYKVKKIELTKEEASPYYGSQGEHVKLRTVAYVTMSLSAYMWGKRVEEFIGRIGLNDECIGLEDESYYGTGGEVVHTLYPDPTSGSYMLFGWCVETYPNRGDGKGSYGCIARPNGATISELQAIFEKAKKPDGTYDCTIPEGQCDYWLNPKDGGT